MPEAPKGQENYEIKSTKPETDKSAKILKGLEKFKDGPNLNPQSKEAQEGKKAVEKREEAKEKSKTTTADLLKGLTANDRLANITIAGTENPEAINAPAMRTPDKQPEQRIAQKPPTRGGGPAANDI